jgi:hypothetical protein
MVALSIPASVTPCVLLASTHAVGDVHFRPVPMATAYGLAAVAIPSAMTTPCFLVASVLHFAPDLGSVGASLALHCGFMLMAVHDMYDAAWCLFAAFYVLVHAPRAVFAWRAERWSAETVGHAARSVVAWTLAACFSMWSFASFATHSGLVLSHSMQRVVVAHAVLNCKK